MSGGVWSVGSAGASVGVGATENCDMSSLNSSAGRILSSGDGTTETGAIGIDGALIGIPANGGADVGTVAALTIDDVLLGSQTVFMPT